MVLLARKDEEGNTQALYDHLHGAGRLASGFEDEFADISRTAAVLHDVGKVAQQFQTYLLSDDGHRGDVQHARQGAFVVNDFFESKGEIEEIAKEILELAISKHHGGLPDCIDESGNRAFLLGFTESDKSNEKYAYQEIKRGLNGLALDLQSNFRGSAEDIACFLKKIKSLRLSKDSIYFYLGLLVKLIYSRLVDADRTDAACFETRKQYRPNAVDWQNLISRLDKSMRSFDSSSEINRIRHQINEQCCLAGARETGIYRLSIPTGGGKTLASLNFALHHALKTGKRRIIYVIPYLSITTQTAKTFRDVLGLNSDSDVLLEHYSTAGMQRSADVADNLEQYYDMLLRKKDGNGKGGYTDCPIRGRAEGATTAYDLLSFNECDRSQFTNTTGGKYGLCFAQAFQTVSDNFHVIPDVTHNVVVPYGQATELLDMLHRGELSEKISVLRRLQEYTVSLFDDDYRDLARKHAISLANEDFGVFLLNEEYYNDKYGVVREAEMPLLLM